MEPNIGFFDSGQGGLTVWESVHARFPQLNTQYIGDNARHPYGNKGADTVTRYTSEAMVHLLNHNAEFIVVACGTASSVAVATLKKIFRVPIVGIVEGLCAEALKLARPGTSVAVLGTRFTVASQSFEKELKRLGANSVWQKACPLFVPLVEEGVTPGPMAHAAAEMYLSDIPMDVSVVILGCTHYPRLAQSIADVVFKKIGRSVIYKSADGEWVMHGDKEDAQPIFLVDSSMGIVNAVDDFLKGRKDSQQFMGSKQDFYCSDAPERFREVARLFTRKELPEVGLVRLGT